MVPPILVRRLKSHFLTLPCGVDLILGLNGYIWVSKHVKENEQEGEEGFDAEAVYSNVNDVRSFVFNLGFQFLNLNVRTSTTLQEPR
jgi:exosome complex RNA-binding protein Rrp4